MRLRSGSRHESRGATIIYLTSSLERLYLRGGIRERPGRIPRQGTGGDRRGIPICKSRGKYVTTQSPDPLERGAAQRGARPASCGRRAARRRFPLTRQRQRPSARSGAPFWNGRTRRGSPPRRSASAGGSSPSAAGTSTTRTPPRGKTITRSSSTPASPRQRGEPVVAEEGCLSCPDIRVEISRYPEIKVRAVRSGGAEGEQALPRFRRPRHSARDGPPRREADRGLRRLGFHSEKAAEFLRKVLSGGIDGGLPGLNGRGGGLSTDHGLEGVDHRGGEEGHENGIEGE